MKIVVLVSVTILVLAAACPAATPTFNKDIAPILYQNCTTCHRPGEVAPFSLLTYADTAKRAELIASATESRDMPPWKPEPGYGSFSNERRLTDAEIELIQEWAAAGAPEGDPAEKPKPPVFVDGWQMGKPDLVLTVPAKYSLPAGGPDQFRCFVLPVHVDHDVYVRGVEFRPGNRRIVHHALLFLDGSGAAGRLAGPDGSYSCFGGPKIPISGLIGGWVPGAVPSPEDEALSQPIRPGMDVVVQIHYHPSGKPEEDQSSLGLTFSGPPTKGRTAVILFNTRLDIPAGDSHYVAKASMEMPRDVELAAITPHAHYLCKDMKVNAHLPDGSTIPLIWIRDWDFKWQGTYRYKKPITLPKGTRVSFEYTYDNSANNPHNPAHPPHRVTWGDQSTDEMAIAFLTITLPSPGDIRPFQRELVRQYLESFFGEGMTLADLPTELPQQQRQALMLAFQLFDRNKDGKLDADESAALIQYLGTRRRRPARD